MLFQTKYNRDDFPRTYEPGGGPVITEQAGDLPLKVQIESMILAGERLMDHRRQLYDYDGDYDDNFDDESSDPFGEQDVTRRRDADIMDVMAQYNRQRGLLREKAAAAAKAAEEAAAAAKAAGEVKKE